MTKTCTKCGEEKLLSEFHKDSGSADGHRPRCKTCVKAYDDTLRIERNKRARESYAADPQAKIVKTRQYHLDHPEWSKERLRASHVAHREERYARHVARGQDEQVQEKRRSATRRSESRRRAAKRGLEAAYISEEQFRLRLMEFAGQCYICERDLGADLHWDHYRPLAAGGTHVIENLRPTCPLCNIMKNSCWPFTEERRLEIRTRVLALAEDHARAAGEEVIRHGN